jgi:YHS domain-containing protein
MTRLTLAAFLIAAATTAAVAQEAPAPEECLSQGGAAAFTVTYAGKTYRMANEACRAQFLSDPERFAQLYDALLELEAEGTLIGVPATQSLVPS